MYVRIADNEDTCRLGGTASGCRKQQRTTNAQSPISLICTFSLYQFVKSSMRDTSLRIYIPYVLRWWRCGHLSLYYGIAGEEDQLVHGSQRNHCHALSWTAMWVRALSVYSYPHQG